MSLGYREVVDSRDARSDGIAHGNIALYLGELRSGGVHAFGAVQKLVFKTSHHSGLGSDIIAKECSSPCVRFSVDAEST